MMVVSHGGVREILDVILKYVDPARVDALIRDLRKIRGNSSYRATIDRIEQVLKEGREEDG